MNSKICIGVGAVSLASVMASSLLFAHVDDPKERDRQPAYIGPAYRAAEGGAPELGFPSNNVTMLGWLPVNQFGSHSAANDCWGYTSPSGREYAIIGLSGGTGFVEVTDPSNPQILVTHSGPNSTWRDIKVHNDHAYVVSEGGSGIQIFDMSLIDSGTVTLQDTVTGNGTDATHNVAIDTTSGYLYRTGGGSNGLRIYRINVNGSLAYQAEWQDRYVHDAQVVTYDSGPYAGRQIAFCNAGFNGGGTQTGLSIVDVTNKDNIFTMSHLQYSGGAYSHQGWLSEDKQYFYLNDELDESNFGHQTRTRVIDVSDLSNPVEATFFTSGSSAIDHNLYVDGDYIYEANYRSGLRVFDASDPLNVQEIAYFDSYPENDGASFNGMWSCYPFFESGTVIGSDIEKGLFVWIVGTPALSYEFPSGLPDKFASNGQVIDVTITEESGTLDASSATVHYSVNGGPYSEDPLALSEAATNFQAIFGALECGASVDYYFSAETTDGQVLRSPLGAPSDTYNALVADDEVILFNDNFQSDLGWSTVNNASVGAWERGVPVGGGDRGDPANDADGSGQCYLTANQDGDSDIDGGTVTLTSPIMDASAETPVLSYYRWFHNSFGGSPFEDIMTVEVSDDGGSSWTLLETVGPGGTEVSGGWYLKEFDLTTIPAFTPNANFRVRFTAGDLGDGSVVEAGIDGVSITSVTCDDVNPCPGDGDGSGTIDVVDLLAMLSVWGTDDADYDVVPDGNIDIQDLLALLASWGPCP